MGELLVMYILSYLAIESVTYEAFADSSLLTIVIAPVMLFTLFRSFLKKIEHRDQTIKQQTLKIAESSKYALLGETYACVAHEIKNLASILQGCAHLTLECKKNKKFAQQEMDFLHDEVEKVQKRMSSVVSEFVNYSKNVKRQDQLINLKTNSLYELVQETVEHCVSGRSKVIIDYSGIPSSIMILCDKHDVLKVFSNLIQNSLEAIENNEQKWIKISAQELTGLNLIEITFSDSGNGIPKQYQATLMDSFFSTKKHGTGHGLSIVKKSIEKYGGTIELDTNSLNTTFKINIPPHSSNNNSTFKALNSTQLH